MARDSKTKSEKKNQHYVPKFLLRQFASPNTREKAVEVFDLDKKVFRQNASISGQCAETYLYGSDGSIENALENLETKASKVIHDIISKKEPLSRRDHEKWALLVVFLAAQYGRTPGAGRELKAKVDGQRKALAELAQTRGYTNIDHWLSSLGLSCPYPEVLALQLALETAHILDDLSDLLIINTSSVEFVLSDIGIVLHNYWTSGLKGIGANGFASQGIVLFFPLSSRLLLVKYDADIYRMCDPTGQTLQISDESEIDALNQIQITFAERNLYFSGDQATKSRLSELCKLSNRSNRASRVHTDIFYRRDNERQVLLHTYVENPPLALNLPWISIQPSYKDVPFKERINQLRPATKAAVAAFQQNGDLSPRKGLQGAVFYREK